MSKPDFTGVWRLDPRRSALEVPTPESSTLTIEHREPRFRLSRSHVLAGVRDTFSTELTTGGKEVVCSHGGLDIRARLTWEGETLVCDSKLSREGVEADNVVRYRLADGGQTLIAEEHFRSAGHVYTNRWVFDRRQPD
jgi:hypothetical protein